jgi:hypothetical protein
MQVFDALSAERPEALTRSASGRDAADPSRYVIPTRFPVTADRVSDRSVAHTRSGWADGIPHAILGEQPVRCARTATSGEDNNNYGLDHHQPFGKSMCTLLLLSNNANTSNKANTLIWGNLSWKSLDGLSRNF